MHIGHASGRLSHIEFLLCILRQLPIGAQDTILPHKLRKTPFGYPDPQIQE
jgi:hypothetical protein